MTAAIWTTSDTWLAVAVLVLLAISGFLAMAETALVRTSRSRARALREQGRRGARPLVRLADAPEKFLNPLLLLLLTCQLVSATMVGVLAGHLFGAAGVIVATAVEVIVIFVVFEAIPKNFAVQHPDRTALVSAPIVAAIVRFPPVRWVSRVLLAVAQSAINLLGGSGWSAHRVTDSEILAMADVALEEDVIADEEREFIHSVIEFGDTIVREVMVPRTDMVDVAGTATVREALDISLESGRSRLPVLGEGVDDVVGIVNLRHLASLVVEGHGADRVADHMGQPRFVPETKKVAALLSEIRQARGHLFVVVDEYGGTAGLVTLEDLLEELVGEITDESDPDQTPVTAPAPGGTGVRVSGRLNIDDANEQFGLDLPKDGWDTVGGLILDLAGGVPDLGQRFETDGYRLTVVRLEGRRVEEVLVERVAGR